MNKTISLCMIVKNEEKVLARCLESAKNLVNEIIIIDTGSVDRTLEIAEKYTNKIYSFEWVNDFSKARNESLKYATSDYILILDADEYLEADADLQEDLKKEYDYYLFNIKNHITSGGRSFTHSAIRLFRNHIHLRYENRLHEHLNVINNTVTFTSGESKQLINHIGYNEETMVEKQKTNRNLPLMLLEVKENPNAYNLYNMGKTYFTIYEFKKAINFFKRAYPLSKDRSFLPELLTKLAYSLAEVGEAEEGLSILMDATNLYPKETEMKYIQGLIYKNSDYNRDAEACFLKCIELGDQGSLISEGSGSYMAHFRLSELYEKMGKLNDSYLEILKAMQLKIKYEAVLQRYFKLTLKLNLPINVIRETIHKLYAFNAVEDLQLLLDTLYGVRHPLLDYFLTRYNISVQPHVTATAKIYSKQYEEAWKLWNAIEKKELESGQDLFLISYLLEKESLITEISMLMNLTSKEKKVIKQVLNKQTITGLITGNLEKILLETCRQLMILGEFDLFQVLAEQLITLDPKYQLKLSTLLGDYGFDELAIDMLITMFKKQPNNIKVIRLLGDLCFRNGYLEDTQLFYSKLLKLDSQYSSYERVLNYFEKIKDKNGTIATKEEIKKRFPMVNN